MLQDKWRQLQQSIAKRLHRTASRPAAAEGSDVDASSSSRSSASSAARYDAPSVPPVNRQLKRARVAQRCVGSSSDDSSDNDARAAVYDTSDGDVDPRPVQRRRNQPQKVHAAAEQRQPVPVPAATAKMAVKAVSVPRQVKQAVKAPSASRASNRTSRGVKPARGVTRSRLDVLLSSSDSSSCATLSTSDDASASGSVSSGTSASVVQCSSDGSDISSGMEAPAVAATPRTGAKKLKGTAPAAAVATPAAVARQHHDRRDMAVNTSKRQRQATTPDTPSDGSGNDGSGGSDSASDCDSDSNDEGVTIAAPLRTSNSSGNVKRHRGPDTPSVKLSTSPRDVALARVVSGGRPSGNRGGHLATTPTPHQVHTPLKVPRPVVVAATDTRGREVKPGRTADRAPAVTHRGGVQTHSRPVPALHTAAASGAFAQSVRYANAPFTPRPYCGEYVRAVVLDSDDDEDDEDDESYGYCPDDGTAMDVGRATFAGSQRAHSAVQGGPPVAWRTADLPRTNSPVVRHSWSAQALTPGQPTGAASSWQQRGVAQLVVGPAVAGDAHGNSKGPQLWRWASQASQRLAAGAAAAAPRR